ncbi:hypothetical protein DXA45_20095 [Enterococcus avium]|nr:hypothetical protein DXA45_20095 [Enterococcus avium]
MYEITLNGDTILSISKIKSSGETGFIYITDKYRGYFDRLPVYKISKKETNFEVRLQVKRMILVIRNICGY